MKKEQTNKTPKNNELSKMTVAQLKALAKEQGKKGYSSLKKSELIALLETKTTSKKKPTNAKKESKAMEKKEEKASKTTEEKIVTEEINLDKYSENVEPKTTVEDNKITKDNSDQETSGTKEVSSSSVEKTEEKKKPTKKHIIILVVALLVLIGGMFGAKAYNDYSSKQKEEKVAQEVYKENEKQALKIIQSYQAKYSESKASGVIAKGDVVSIRYTVKLDDQEYEGNKNLDAKIIIGENLMNNPEIDNRLIGKKVGDQVTIDSNVENQSYEKMSVDIKVIGKYKLIDQSNNLVKKITNELSKQAPSEQEKQALTNLKTIEELKKYIINILFQQQVAAQQQQQQQGNTPQQ